MLVLLFAAPVFLHVEHGAAVSILRAATPPAALGEVSVWRLAGRDALGADDARVADVDDHRVAEIEPDPKAGTVVISGEGPDYLAALNYVLDLERGGTLLHPHLVRHERRDDTHVTFAVSASWSSVQ